MYFIVLHCTSLYFIVFIVFHCIHCICLNLYISGLLVFSVPVNSAVFLINFNFIRYIFLPKDFGLSLPNVINRFTESGLKFCFTELGFHNWFDFFLFLMFSSYVKYLFFDCFIVCCLTCERKAFLLLKSIFLNPNKLSHRFVVVLSGRLDCNLQNWGLGYLDNVIC